MKKRNEPVNAYHKDGVSMFNKAYCPDPVYHPTHYKSHPSGVECIDIAEHFNFCLGNAMKYIWRAGLKQDALEDLKKARWYLDREISRWEVKGKEDGTD